MIRKLSNVSINIIMDYLKIQEQLLIAQAQSGKSNVIKRIHDLWKNDRDLII